MGTSIEGKIYVERFLDFDVNINALIAAYFVDNSGDSVVFVLTYIDIPQIESY